MAVQLSTGKLRTLYEAVPGAGSCTVQILNIRLLTNTGLGGGGQSQDSLFVTLMHHRYRMTISDGVNMCQAMPATQLNERIMKGEFEKHCIVTIQEFMCNQMQSKKIIIALKMERVGFVNNMIGNPVSFDSAGVPTGPQNGTPNRPGTGGSYESPDQNVQSSTTNFHNQHNGSGYHAPMQQHQQMQQTGGHFDTHQPIKSDPMGGMNYGRPQQQQNLSGVGLQQNQGMHNQNQFNNAPSNFNNHNAQNGMGGTGGQYGGGAGYNQGGSWGYQQQEQGGGGFGGVGGGGVQNRGILQTDDPHSNITPIGSLTPYTGKWTIQARLTVKAPMKHYKNAKGEGRLFSVDLMDNTCDIRGTFFNEDADRFMEQLQANKVYRVRGGNLKPANKQFTTTKSEFEITFGKDTFFEPCAESMAPKVSFDFRGIDKIESIDPNSVVDIIGVIQEVCPVGEITVKSGANAGNKVPKREVVIVDQSSNTIRLTLWDQHKDLVNESDNSHPVVAVKNCRVSDFGGRSLSTTRSSMLELNPDLQEAHNLRGWYDMQGGQVNFTAVSGGGGGGMRDPRKTTEAAKGESLGHGDKPDFFTVRGSISFLKKDGTWHYTADPATKKKVVEQGDQWWVEATQQLIDRCERRYILSCVCSDHCGSMWLSCFNDAGKIIMGGMSADELHELSLSDPSAYDGVWQRANFQSFIFKVRAKSESWQDETRVKYVVQECAPLNFQDGCSELLASIRQYGV